MGKEVSVLPSIDCCTPSLLSFCESIYQETVRQVYSSRPNLKDRKLKEALEDDDFRFNVLPSRIASGSVVADRGKTEGKGNNQGNSKRGLGLQKEELERLVRWKITHGVNRPFLPGLVRKNEDEFIESITTEAHEKILEHPGNLPAQSVVQSALKILCKLKGIGPATASLILSIFDPDNIPFFQDELAGWILGNSGKSDAKLKYNEKEYESVLQGVAELKDRLTAMPALQGHLIRCVAVEKTAYVLRHMDVLSQKDKDRIRELLSGVNDANEDNSETKQEPSKEYATIQSTASVGEESAEKPSEDKERPSKLSAILDKTKESRNTRSAKQNVSPPPIQKRARKSDDPTIRRSKRTKP